MFILPIVYAQKGDVYFNYGCFPRTWEDPNEIDHWAGHPGDNDPLDVCEIGLRIMKTAEITPGKTDIGMMILLFLTILNYDSCIIC